jgi:probable HAF family extracellular repeat protein
VTGLRFYKGAANEGTHVGHLWTSGGALLAEATFTGESASGWQTVSFASPVPLTPGVTYVASYHSSSGFFALDAGYFAAARIAGPLELLADGADGPNGVFRYGASGFPDQDGNGSNYWVDVSFVPDAPFDGDPPGVESVSPAAGASGVAFGQNVTARFDEAMDPASLDGASFELRDGASALVPASVSYAGATRTATLDPAADLAPSTTYTATVKGGASGALDLAGNPLPADFVWSFTTAPPPPPPPDEGPGGPILVVANAANPFGRYLAEILRTEGLNAFGVTDASNLTAPLLAAHEVVILGEQPLDAAQVALLTAWVDGGGKLVAMRPDPDLAGLLGLAPAGGTLSEGYLAIDTGAAPGAGLVGETLQFHGTADLWTLAGATALATLHSDATTATSHPAVTLRSVGSNGGFAAAFSYDLARSVVYTRQGNPAWAGEERDGQQPPILRSDDLFFPDWIDLDKVAIPQADEQQRLLVKLIEHVAEPPLPRFWYFPSGHRAVVVMTGDQHGCCGGTRDRFDADLAADPPSCSVEDWECVRSSSYLYPDGVSNPPPGSGMGDLEGLLYHAQGFELGVHVNTGCANWTPATLDAFFTSQLATFASQFPSLPGMDSHRTHCITWSDWASAAEVELAHGVRLDTNYYYWPPSWVDDRPGLFTGSGMPMRFARTDGSLIDVYQAVTQMTDESGQTYPFTIDALLDRALGPEGYYGAFTANMHTDGASHSIAGHAAIVASAQARGVPVVSGRQLLEWLDGRNASSWALENWDGDTLAFSLTPGAGARNLRALLPLEAGTGPLTSLTRGGAPVAFTTELIKGTTYAVFPAEAGSYVASFALDELPPAITDVTALPAADGSALVEWNTDEAATSRVDYGTAPDALTSFVTQPGFVSTHAVPLGGLAPATTYYYRVASADAFGNAATDPAPPAAPRSFTTPAGPCLTDTTAGDFAAGAPDAGAHVSSAGGGELILAPTDGSDFDGGALPAGWSATAWAGGGSAVVAGGALAVDGARAGTDASFGPGRSLEFVATFAGAPFQHAGFGVSYEGAPWAMFSTGAAGTGVLARSHDGITATDTPLGAGRLGAPHRFRIDWGAGAIDFFVDGALVASHPVAIGAGLRPLVSDLGVGGPALSVDWLRLSPFAPAGSFLSRVADAGLPASWGAVSFSLGLPAATSVAVLARSGPTALPDAFWSPFAPIPSSGAALGQVGRFAQYRLDLASADPAETPAVRDVTLACTPAPETDTDGDGIADVHETDTGVYVSPTDTGTDPLDPDSDADGFADGLELAAGADPNDPAAFPAPGGGARLLALGVLPGGAAPARSLAVSADGLAVAGAMTTPGGVEAFRWTAAGGMQPLGDLAGGAVEGIANGIAAGGESVVGGSESGAGPEAFRWTAGGGTVGLGDLAGGAFASEAFDVSADGAVVVGTATSTAGSEAFRWTAGGGLVGIGDLAGGAFASEARGVSADGAVVVGTGSSSSGPQAFRWTPAGMVALGDLAGGAFASAANDVSANGAVCVGVGTSALGPNAFRRVQPSPLRPLGELPGGVHASEALATSADGAVVVGTSEGAAGPEAFVWTAANGLRTLQAVLEADLGLDLSGWERLVAAEDVSDDGRTLVGHGLRGGEEHAFVAYLDTACNNGANDDGDSAADYPFDAGCSSPLDTSELPDCADGLDNDGDGLVDSGADPSCSSAAPAARELTSCSNGLDDDGDGAVDFPADTLCQNAADDDEAANPSSGGGCGLGPELALLLAGLLALRRRRG